MYLVVIIFKEGMDVEVCVVRKEVYKINRKGWNERVYYIFRIEFFFYVFFEKEKVFKGNV